MRRAGIITLATVLVGCGGEANYNNTNATLLKVKNAEGEVGVLRTGTAVNISAAQAANLKPDSNYTVVVTDLDTGRLVSHAYLLTDGLGRLDVSTVAHDLGEFDDGVKAEHTLAVAIHDDVRPPDALGPRVGEILIPVTPHLPVYVGHGFTVDEVQPPHIFSSDSTGKALNAYVVGALPAAGEVEAPIYASGHGFPKNISQVKIYIAKDRDKWQGERMPQPGDAHYIAGPFTGKVVDGKLQPTKLDWLPTGKHIGPYDLLVDVDDNGVFDYSRAAKDAADGEDKVGVTLQYGQRWFAAKAAVTQAQLSITAAKQARAAADKAASDAEAAATTTPAKQKAAEARAAANEASALVTTAETAAAAAQRAFDQMLADDATAKQKADTAKKAAEDAAAKAKLAAELVSATKQAEAAEKARLAAIAAQNLSRHLIVNLAFDSKSRKGAWKNDFTTSDQIFAYVNPPVQRGERHAFVTKLVVPHQSFSGYWNNPQNPNFEEGGKAGFGRVKLPQTVKMTGGTTQKSCTNSPPIKIINPGLLPIDDGAGLLKYDIVFDYDNDGYYDIGRDMLDVVGHTDTGELVSAADLSKIDPDKIYGFAVRK
jgi:hypothetical protein